MHKHAGKIGSILKVLSHDPIRSTALGTAAGLGTYAIDRRGGFPKHLQTEQSKYNRRKGGWMVGGGVAGGGLGMSVGGMIAGNKGRLAGSLLGLGAGVMAGKAINKERTLSDMEEKMVARKQPAVYPYRVKF